MSFNALLDRLCDIQANTVAQDTAQQKIKTWANVATNVKCRLEPIGGGLMKRPTVVFQAATHTLFMRAQSGLILTLEDNRIVIGSDTYTILLIQDLHSYKNTDHLELILELDE